MLCLAVLYTHLSRIEHPRFQFCHGEFQSDPIPFHFCGRVFSLAPFSFSLPLFGLSLPLFGFSDVVDLLACPCFFSVYLCIVLVCPCLVLVYPCLVLGCPCLF